MAYKTNKPSKAKWSGIIFAATFLAFPILQFIVFYLGVNVKSWISAFQPEFGEEFSLINFRLFFIELKDPLNAMSSTIKNSLTRSGLIIRRLSGAKVRLLHGLWFSAYGRASAIR